METLDRQAAATEQKAQAAEEAETQATQPATAMSGTPTLATLNPAARVALANCEQRIERGLKTFIDVGQALAEIRDNRLYKGTHETFEAYLEQRWQISRAHAYRMISAAEVVSPIGDTGLPAPTKESQARELAKVAEADRADVWREAVERTDGKPTAAAVREVHEERTRPVSPGPAGAERRPPADPGVTPVPVVDHSTTAPAVPPQGPDLAAEILRVLGEVDYRLTVPEIARRIPGGASDEDLLRALYVLHDARKVVVGATPDDERCWGLTPKDGAEMPPRKVPEPPTAERLASLHEPIVTVLADAAGSLSTAQVWARLPMSVHSNEVDLALHALAEMGRVDPAGRALHGNRMEPLWQLATETAEPEMCLGRDMDCGRPLPCPDHPRTPAERIAAVAEVAPEFVQRVEPPDEARAFLQRTARKELRRVVDALAPVGRAEDFVETWADQLGAYDDELSELVERAQAAIAVLDDLIERCGR